MRPLTLHTVLAIALALTLTTADPSPFSPALIADDTTLYDPLADANATTAEQPTRLLQQRQSNPCASSYAQCPGAPSLCCPSNSQCLPDARGMVGCCPNGAACTGYVGSEPTPGASSSAAASSPVSAAASSAMTTTGASLLGSLTATGTGAGQTIFAAGAHEGRERRGVGVGAAVAAFVGALVL